MIANRRKLRLSLAAVGVVAPLLLVTGCADDPQPLAKQAPSASITNQWVAATDGSTTNAYAAVSNTGTSRIHLVGVSTDAAGKTELQGGDNGFVIEPDQSLIFGLQTPNHIVLQELKKPLNIGESISITLRFSDGSTESFDAIGRSPATWEEGY